MTHDELLTAAAIQSMRRKRLRRRALLIFVCILFAALVTAAIGYAVVVNFFNLDSVVVEGNRYYSADLLIAGCGADKLAYEGVNLYELDIVGMREDLLLDYPYLNSVKLSRQLPSTLKITVKEDAPHYYAVIADEYFVLSDTLRVLERSETAEQLSAQEPPLVRIVSPEIDYAIVGQSITFTRKDMYDYSTQLLNTLEQSEIGDKLTLINYADRFNIYIVYEDRFKIIIGSQDGLNKKLEFARAIIEQYFKPGDIATIDVQSKPGFAIMEQSLELDLPEASGNTP